MTDVVGSDIPQGPEVKWYEGGVAVKEEIAATAGQTSITLASSATAEFGSTLLTVNGSQTEHLEIATGTTPATEASGTTKITFSALTLNDVVELFYIKTSGTGNSLVHIASCTDVKCDSNASTKTAAVHGQATKLNSIGALENTADLEEFYYNAVFTGAIMGDLFADAPITGGYKWTNKIHGVKKIGALVGKRVNSSNEVIYKWFLIGAQATGISGTFPTEDMYKRSMKFMVDYWSECDLT
jgi:hypothetical protein